MKHILYSVFVLVASFTLNSCSDDTVDEAFDINKMLEGYSTLISEKFTSFKLEIDTLNIVVNEFNEVTTFSNLNTVQIQLLKCLEQFQSLKPFNIGEIKNNLFLAQMGQWPIQTVSIENVFVEEENIDSTLLTSLGANVKGLFTLEYLVFNNQKSNAEILLMFNSDENFQNRKQYLIEIVSELSRTSQEMLDIWNNYRPAFLNGSENIASGSENRIYNESVAALSELLNTVRVPFESYTIDGILPSTANLMAWNSSTTKEILLSEIEMLKSIFQNNLYDGFDDHLNSVNAVWEDDVKVADAIIDAYDNSYRILLQINNLESAILNNDTIIQEFIDSIRYLLQLYRSDMVSWLSLVLLVSDADGD